MKLLAAWQATRNQTHNHMCMNRCVRKNERNAKLDDKTFVLTNKFEACIKREPCTECCCFMLMCSNVHWFCWLLCTIGVKEPRRRALVQQTTTTKSRRKKGSNRPESKIIGAQCMNVTITDRDLLTVCRWAYVIVAIPLSLSLWLSCSFSLYSSVSVCAHISNRIHIICSLLLRIHSWVQVYTAVGSNRNLSADVSSMKQLQQTGMDN